MTLTAPESLRAGWREWAGLAVLALPSLLLSIDFSTLFLVLPQMSAELAPTSTQQLWTANIHGFMIAGFLITMGTLGDRIGRRRLLMIGAVAFAVGSVAAAFAVSAEMLIAARALMGVAGATLMPSILSLISAMFPAPRQRAVAIAVFMSSYMAGTAIGPLVGGALLERFWWGSVFLMGTPVMLLLLVTGPSLLPEYKNPQANRLDVLSVALSLAAILPTVYGITESARLGLRPGPSLAIVAGLLFGVLFLVRQRKLADPLLDLGLFANRSYTGALLALLIAPCLMGGVGLYVNQFLQMVRELTPFEAGLWLLPSTSATILSAMLSPFVARRLRPGYLVSVAGLSLTIGCLVFTQVASVGGLGTLVTGFVFVGIGFGAITALGTGLVVGAAPPEKAGVAAAMSETSSQLGLSLGIAVLGSIGTAIYRSQAVDFLPAGLPGPVGGAIQDSLAGALTVAPSLPGPAAGLVVGPARDAFTDGLNVALGVGAGLGAVVAVVAAFLLGRARIAGKPAAGSEVPAAIGGMSAP